MDHPVHPLATPLSLCQTGISAAFTAVCTRLKQVVIEVLSKVGGSIIFGQDLHPPRHKHIFGLVQMYFCHSRQSKSGYSVGSIFLRHNQVVVVAATLLLLLLLCCCYYRSLLLRCYFLQDLFRHCCRGRIVTRPRATYWRLIQQLGIVCRQQFCFWHRCYHATLLLILCLQTLIFQVWLNLTNSAANT